MKNHLANSEKLQCQNVDDSNNSSKYDTSKESLTGNVHDNEMQLNGAYASENCTSEESPNSNAKYLRENK